ncbi:MAG: hypothetical protein HDT43_04980 [Ruminococcaceae bacterium]|nr:hypothetical protein [Oscillospiraceae bacterium]
MKYYDSFKLFHGKNTIKECGALIAGNTALLIVGGVLIRVVNNEHFQGFVTGMLTFLGGVVAMTLGFALVSAVFNGNWREQPGYKFFHSVADGAGHFRRATLFSNVLSLFPIAMYAVVGGIMFGHFMIVIMTITAFFMMGLINFTSHIKSPWVRIGSFSIVGFAFGFYAGINGKGEEDIPTFPLNVTIIICAILLAFYIVSLIMVTVKAEERWNREG